MDRVTSICDRVELRGSNPIEATIIWKADFRQKGIIHRHRGKRDLLTVRYWTKTEDALLKKHFPDSLPEVIMSELPGRTWKAITRRGGNLRLKRRSKRYPVHNRRKWTITEDERLKEGYESGKTVALLAKELNRSVYSIQVRVALNKLSRPSCAMRQPTQVLDESNNPTYFQSSLSGRGLRSGSLCN